MISRIYDKIKEIEEFMEFISKRIPKSLNEYKNNLEIKAVCERYIEKIIESSVDISFIFYNEIKSKKEIKVRIPDDDSDVFNILKEWNIISDKLLINLKQAKGMRNILAHEYGKIEDYIVYNSLKEELLNDVSELIGSITEYLKENKLK